MKIRAYTTKLADVKASYDEIESITDRFFNGEVDAKWIESEIGYDIRDKSREEVRLGIPNINYYIRKRVADKDCFIISIDNCEECATVVMMDGKIKLFMFSDLRVSGEFLRK